ncbi:type IV CRISPR-associated protein Csf2 [Rhodoferax antarcticus]|uniref:Putative CRISPR-associated protein n=1 Tax=Rhodoferax antarcticus ANT.BR TaxID=1111071 RepID=A0A1Q8Y8Y7_9BURK|nr:type IV CRISPR-associated protein Csf2 [Rhodoferax antarcticus]OLP04485.1 putative CRISPR-associated protein [Rhodoferax antarcticus ANT.BR]
MKKTVSIHAILTTLSPLHIASPESFRYDINNSTGYGRVKNGTKGGIACAGIQRRHFSGVDGVPFGLPVIAANNVAGRLRRQASKIVLDLLRKKNQRITLATYAALTCGAITGIPDSRDLTFAEYKDSSNHPLIGLLGGGPRMLRRRMQVLDALPVMQVLREGGYSVAHPNSTGRETNASNITYGTAFKRGDDISSLLDVDRMADTVEDFENAFFARQKLILEDKAKKDADDAAKKEPKTVEPDDKNKELEEKSSRYSTKAWSAFEFVAPGVDFDFTINLVDVTDAQIGLFLLALNGLSKTHLGGQSRNGLGRFKFNDVIIVDKTNGDNNASEPIFNNNDLMSNHEAIAAYIAAWKTATEGITASKMDEIMRPPVGESDDEKKAKADAKAAKAAEKKAGKSTATA